MFNNVLETPLNTQLSLKFFRIFDKTVFNLKKMKINTGWLKKFLVQKKNRVGLYYALNIVKHSFKCTFKKHIEK